MKTFKDIMLMVTHTGEIRVNPTPPKVIDPKRDFTSGNFLVYSGPTLACHDAAFIVMVDGLIWKDRYDTKDARRGKYVSFDEAMTYARAISNYQRQCATKQDLELLDIKQRTGKRPATGHETWQDSLRGHIVEAVDAAKKRSAGKKTEPHVFAPDIEPVMKNVISLDRWKNRDGKSTMVLDTAKKEGFPVFTLRITDGETETVVPDDYDPTK